MNITEYQDSSPGWIEAGEAVLDERFVLICGNDAIYRFLGKNSACLFSALVHKDDAADFIKAYHMAQSGSEQHILIRVQNCRNCYNVVHVCMRYGREENLNRTVWYLKLYDIIGTERRSEFANENVWKYRLFMSMIKESFLEYEVDTELLQIYTYTGGKSTVLCRMKLDEWREKCIAEHAVAPKDWDAFEKLCENLKNGKDEYICEIKNRILAEDEEYETWKIHCRAMYKNLKRDKVVGVISAWGSSTEENIPYYLTEAGKDPATGLFNKRAIMEYTIERLGQLLGKESIYFVVLDIDNFKMVNDQFGHMFGDEVIERVADIVKQVVGNRGAVGRFGGDEFFFTLERVSEEELVRILKTIRKNVEWEFWVKTGTYHITMSIGISLSEVNGRTYEELFEKADKALYIAKEKGKNRYILYNEEQHNVQNTLDCAAAPRITAEARAEQRALGLASLLCNLQKKGREGLSEVIQDAKEYFSLASVCIYAGNPLCIYYCDGREETSGPGYVYKQEYLSGIGERGFFILNNRDWLEQKNPEILQWMSERGIEAMMHYVHKDEEGIPQYIISYETHQLRRKWSEEDKNFLLILSHVIVQILHDRG